MSNEKKKAFETIERLNEEALQGVNVFLSWVFEQERNRADISEERMRELKEEVKRKEEEKKIRIKREEAILKVSEKVFENISSETLQEDNMQEETMDFICRNAESLKIYLKWHPEKIFNVIEVIHTHGVKAGENKKSHQPSDQTRQATFFKTH